MPTDGSLLFVFDCRWCFEERVSFSVKTNDRTRSTAVSYMGWDRGERTPNFPLRKCKKAQTYHELDVFSVYKTRLH